MRVPGADSVRSSAMSSGETPDKLASVLPRWSTKLWHDHPVWVLAGGAVLALAVIIELIWPITDLIAAHDVGLIASRNRAAALQAAREAVRTQLLTLGAGLFAAGALVFTAWNLTLYRRNLSLLADTNRIAEQGQVTDRFIKAIEQLGSVKLDVRVGGIYALDRVARDSRRKISYGDDSPGRIRPRALTRTVAAAARARDRPHTPTYNAPGRPSRRQYHLPPGRSTLLVRSLRRRASRREASRAKLHGANFENGANLDRANLIGADLSDARLNSASLRGTLLDYADLSGASLVGADFNGTDLGKVHLRGAGLAFAHFNDADLSKADLNEVDLSEADLSGAKWPEDATLPPGWVRHILFKDRLQRDRRDLGVQETDLPAESSD